MLATFQFSLDTQIPPQNAALSGMVAGDRATVVAVGPGFDAADVIDQAALTMKVSSADADNASTTIQKILNGPLALASGDIALVDTAGTTRVITFALSPADTAALVTQRFYDIRLWVTRADQQYDRLIQRGTLSVQAL